MELDQNNKIDFLESGGQKSSGLKTPDGYFESFEKSILAQLKADEQETKVIPITRESSTLKIWVMLAVAASLIWAAFWVFNPSNESVEPVNQMAEITVDDFDYYDMDDFLLAENITDTELENIDLYDDYLSADEIYEYMQNEDISEYILTENF